jgi:hypothetical protein
MDYVSLSLSLYHPPFPLYLIFLLYFPLRLDDLKVLEGRLEGNHTESLKKLDDESTC